MSILMKYLFFQKCLRLKRYPLLMFLVMWTREQSIVIRRTDKRTVPKILTGKGEPNLETYLVCDYFIRYMWHMYEWILLEWMIHEATFLFKQDPPDRPEILSHFRNRASCKRLLDKNFGRRFKCTYRTSLCYRWNS